MKIVERTDGPTSMGASFFSPAIHLESLQGFSISAFWTETSGSLEGTITIQASNNAFTGNTSNEENADAQWDDVPGLLAMVEGSGSFFFNAGECFFKAARIKWERTSGDGDFTANIYAKGWV